MGREKRGRKLASHLQPITRLHFNSCQTQPRRRNDALLTLLRRVARAGRSNQPQPFYSIRKVATRFCVSPTTVARIFDRLKAEGLLQSAWGSKTTLQALNLDRQLRMRGLIALLVPITSFGEQDGRTFVASLSSELWKLGFASRLWLYAATEPESLSCLEGLIREKPDAIVWFGPSQPVAALANLLLDSGIRVVRIPTGSVRLHELATCISPSQRAAEVAREVTA